MEGGGGRGPFFPLPHPALSTFLLSSHFSCGPNFVRVVRERLLRKLDLSQKISLLAAGFFSKGHYDERLVIANALAV